MLLSNLEKYAPPDLLSDLRGSSRIADGAVPHFARAPAGRGLWLHANDPTPELGPLADFALDAVAEVG